MHCIEFFYIMRAMIYKGRIFNKKKMARDYRRMGTRAFSEKYALSLNQAKRIARIYSWRKDADTVCDSRRNAANARWRKRVVCAIEQDGLLHAVHSSYGEFVVSSDSKMLHMRCGARFVPVEIRLKGFPACTKCKDIDE